MTAELYSDDKSEKIETFIAAHGDMVKSLERLLPSAAKLKKLEEWEAAKRLIKHQIAQECVKVGKGLVGGEGVHHKQGFIRGMDYVVELIEVHFEKAIEQKKAALAAKAKKGLTQE